MLAVSQRNWNICDWNAWVELEEDVQSSAGLAQQVEVELHGDLLKPEYLLIELWPCYDFACHKHQHTSDKIFTGLASYAISLCFVFRQASAILDRLLLFRRVINFERIKKITQYEVLL